MARAPRTSSTTKPAWSGIAPGRYRSGVARGRGLPGKAVGAFVPGLTRKAFEKFGFSTATLIMDWGKIAGGDLAQWTTPERVKWPQTPDNAELSEADGRSSGATLLLRVDPARALDVEYRARQIVERINAYFGYRAIGEIRIVQTPIVAANAGAQPAPPMASAADCAAPRAPASELVAIADDGLRQALTRMQAGIEATRPARSCLQRAADTRTAG